ncbi:carnitine O-palmitoyltransferase 1, liver isoform-like isoform X2 [Clavelina lepadiformis]|uniref:carnitine O-palmitoyltransferase 1, liver isoform-like isoform X2 n=1 Tax=Clavelina lepadiformis TaxID=159417 RepID=UPI0040417F72
MGDHQSTSNISVCNLIDWMYDQKSSRTKAWGMLLSLLMPKKNKLFALQEYLPKYPLPKLEETCKRTLSMVKPLVHEKEYAAIQEAIDELKQNEGPKLQKILEERYKTEENWLSELWDKYVYLAGRSPIPVASNFCLLGDLKFKQHTPVSHQLSQAANHIRYAMEYKERVETGTLRNMMIQNIVPICCHRYNYVCSTTRIPQEDVDDLKTFRGTKHIVVFCKGSMYRLDMYSIDVAGNESLLTPREIQSKLEDIVKDASKRKAVAGTSQIVNPSIFTTTDRTRWAKIRKSMLKDEENATSLNVVETSAFCVALDNDEEPKNISEEFHLYMTGNGYNRWFDKSLTMIFASNGAMGLNVEHTSAEATLAGRLWEFGYYHSKYDANGDAMHQGLQHTNLPVAEYLSWNLDDYSSDIADVKDKWEELVKDFDAYIFLADKGKSFIKKLRVSPDGYIQMALQLAFYRRHKETPKTYETAATRLFKYGRTETIRSVSEHSVQFTKTFDDPAVPSKTKVDHLKAAIKHQTLYKYDAMNGQAVDRHLLGLYLAGKFSKSVPKLFTLKPFSETDKLSTSQSPLRYDPVISKKLVNVTDPVGGGFGAQRPDGYGISYFMDDEKIHFLIASFHQCDDTDSAEFGEDIQRAIDDMKTLMEATN